MTRGLFYKLIIILFTVALGVVWIMPTVGEKTMEVSFTAGATAEQREAVRKRFSVPSYRVADESGAVAVTGINLNDAILNEVRSQFPGVDDAKLRPHWSEKYFYAKKVNLGLDLQGGMQLVLAADYERMEKKSGRKLTDDDKKDITEQALEMIRNRIDAFGVSEPSIRSKGAEAIEIQLPGVKDPDKVKKVFGFTGKVEYRLVDNEYSSRAMEWLKANYKEEKLPLTSKEQFALLEKIAKGVNLPAKLEVLFYFERVKGQKDIYPVYPIALQREVALEGSDISKAWIGNDEYGRLSVHFTTTADGAKKFSIATSEKNHGKKLSIVIDDKVRSAPQINVHITSGQALIQGDFSQEEVEMLTRIIKEGALPVDLRIMEERSVGPSLGQDSINDGLKALLVATGGIGLFMIFYYKFAGLISGLGLVLNSIFLLALLSRFGFVITLPGIAGFILTVGMAVDANVLIYERMREEQRSGKSPASVVTLAFDRAFWTIFDSNLTTMIGAIFLSRVPGSIKGFSVTLIIGLICSMFVACYVTRFVYEMIILKKDLKKISV